MTKWMHAIVLVWAPLAASLAILAVPSALAHESNWVGCKPLSKRAEIRVPARKRVSISVSNEDPTPEEFDSSALKVEKVIAGKSKALVRIGPLEPGRYEFIGEFHAETAKGAVIAE